MTTPVRTCRTTALLGDAARIMLDAGCGCVPVVDRRGRLVGMLTDRDVCLAVAARHQSPWEIPVRDVMSPNIVSVPIDERRDRGARGDEGAPGAARADRRRRGTRQGPDLDRRRDPEDRHRPRTAAGRSGRGRAAAHLRARRAGASRNALTGGTAMHEDLQSIVAADLAARRDLEDVKQRARGPPRDASAPACRPSATAAARRGRGGARRAGAGGGRGGARRDRGAPRGPGLAPRAPAGAGRRRGGVRDCRLRADSPGGRRGRGLMTSAVRFSAGNARVRALKSRLWTSLDRALLLRAGVQPDGRPLSGEPACRVSGAGALVCDRAAAVPGGASARHLDAAAP